MGDFEILLFALFPVYRRDLMRRRGAVKAARSAPEGHGLDSEHRHPSWRAAAGQF